ncbi:MAG: TetR/AcrR family transcriptional regulator [Bradyrhizobium sp.]
MTEGKSDARLETWIEAGFGEIARTGVEGVRVEVLAKNLGVTKGGFYRRFRDRAALLEAMLQNWRDGRIAAIEKQTSLDGAGARERLKALIALYSERMNTEGKNTAGLGIELAIRQWARSDELAANAVASVDAARLKNVGHLYRATGLAAEEADAQAFLFYCFIFGQSLLFLERGPRKRAQLVAKSAEKLIEDESA